MAEPILSLFPVETFDINLMAIKDISTYPNGYNIISPFLQVDVPSYGTVNVTFTPKDINVLNSAILGLSKGGENLMALPDGIYTLKYSINPAYKYNVTKNIMRVDKLYKKFDEAFLAIQSSVCDTQLSRNQRIKLNEIEWWIQGAISSANRCATKQAMEMYRKASTLIDQLDSKC